MRFFFPSPLEQMAEVRARTKHGSQTAVLSRSAVFLSGASTLRRPRQTPQRLIGALVLWYHSGTKDGDVTIALCGDLKNNELL